jgi:GWxTD domain-containing protein
MTQSYKKRHLAGRLVALQVLLSVAVAGSASASALGYLPQERSETTQDQRQEERAEYYTKWLNEDVVYIIAPDEKGVFEGLSNDDERDQFIEQFWLRRDPDLSTGSNEVKEEHYRRIAYANERFTSGRPGWKSDCGRIYIIHGEPVEIEKHQSGEYYERPAHEGGGFTSVFPFQIWRYRHIEGIGNDVELEFVDPSGSGEFRLALNQWEKDAFLFAPTLGSTIAESMGMATRGQRSYFHPGEFSVYPMSTLRAKDEPFNRYRTMAMVQRPKQIKYNDLKEIVEVDIGFDNLEFETRMDYFRLDENRVLVPITFELQNKDLTFRLENGVHVARIAIYGLVTSITHRVVHEFEDDLEISFRPRDFEAGILGRSVYQKIVPVEAKVRYRLDMVIKDLQTDNVGVIRQAIMPPAFPDEQLTASSVILSDYIFQVHDFSGIEETFLIGDVKIRPNPGREFSASKILGAYMQIYNAAIEQTSLKPDLRVRYQILQGGKMVKYWSDKKGESIQFLSSQRVVLVKPMSIEGLKPGAYRFVAEIEDRLSNKTVSVSEDFRVKAGDAAPVGE